MKMNEETQKDAEAKAAQEAEAAKAVSGTDDPKDGDSAKKESKENTLIDDTNLAAKRLEEATQASKEERLAAEKSYSNMKLGGSAGGQVPAKAEISEADYADQVMQGNSPDAK